MTRKDQRQPPADYRNCVRCPRLAKFLEQKRLELPGYFNLPVPAFGDPDPQLLVVGLAPGLHGANRSGRPFTGDHAGILLYRTLHQFGFSNNPESLHETDGLALTGCRITNAVRCVPPQNKPLGVEINLCNSYLAGELKHYSGLRVILALGGIAHRAILKSLGLKQSGFAFSHGAEHELPDGRFLVNSYHCSRYNLNTRRLTSEMFMQVFERIVQFL